MQTNINRKITNKSKQQQVDKHATIKCNLLCNCKFQKVINANLKTFNNHLISYYISKRENIKFMIIISFPETFMRNLNKKKTLNKTKQNLLTWYF